MSIAITRNGRRRARRYDYSVLRWVARYRVVTLHQVAYRFWYLDGRSCRHAYRVVKRLHDAGLVRYAPYQPHKGAASRRLLMLTEAARVLLDLPPIRDPMAEPHRQRMFRLEVAQLEIDLEAEGYRESDPDDAWECVRRAALTALRRVGVRNEYDRLVEDRIRRFTPPGPLPFSVWARADNDCILSVGHQTRAEMLRAIASLPEMRFLQPLRFRVVAADEAVGLEAVQVLQRALRGRRFSRFTVDATVPWYRMGNPAEWPPLTVSRYATAGVANPLAYEASRSLRA